MLSLKGARLGALLLGSAGVAVLLLTVVSASAATAVGGCSQEGCDGCSDGVCTHCTIDYSLDNKTGVCTICNDTYDYANDPCWRCQETDGTVTCLGDLCTYYAAPLADRSTCVPNNILNCKFYDNSIHDLCARCAPGYRLNTEHTGCVPCTDDVPMCLRCLDDKKCVACPLGYTVFTDHCMECKVPGCERCKTVNVCETCMSKHTPHTQNGVLSCTECKIDGCKSCATAGKCDVCEAQHTGPVEGKCIECKIDRCVKCSSPNVCSDCGPGYDFDSVNKKCVPCTEGCAKCEKANTCSECLPKHTVTGTAPNLRCTACDIDSCTFCDSKNMCAKCADGWQVALGARECTKCSVASCLACKGIEKCGVCECGMVPSASGACVACTAEHCRYCVNPGDGGRCSACEEGYSPNGNGRCAKDGLPSWGLMLILTVVLFVVAAGIAVANFLYHRHQAKQLQLKRDADERRRNRQVRGRQHASHFDMCALDLRDLEAAATGLHNSTVRRTSRNTAGVAAVDGSLT